MTVLSGNLRWHGNHKRASTCQKAESSCSTIYFGNSNTYEKLARVWFIESRDPAFLSNAFSNRCMKILHSIRSHSIKIQLETSYNMDCLEELAGVVELLHETWSAFVQKLAVPSLWDLRNSILMSLWWVWKQFRLRFEIFDPTVHEEIQTSEAMHLTKMAIHWFHKMTFPGRLLNDRCITTKYSSNM